MLNALPERGTAGREDVEEIEGQKVGERLGSEKGGGGENQQLCGKCTALSR